MPKMNLSHFEAAVLFSLLVSVVLAWLRSAPSANASNTASTRSVASWWRFSGWVG